MSSKGPPSMDWNNLNDLNNPPGEESVGKWVSRLARELFVPVLVPLSTAFIAWLAQRQVNDQRRDVRRESEKVAKTKEVVDTPQFAAIQETRSGATLAQSLAEIAERRRHAEVAIASEEAAAADKIMASLNEFRPLLKRRQDIYCDMLTHRSHRHQIEAELKRRAYEAPFDKDLALYRGVLDIVEHDTNCSGLGKGALARSYLLFWETKAQMLKYKRVLERTKQINELPTKPVN